MVTARTLPKLEVVDKLGTPESWATFSPCRQYRYALGRRWGDGDLIVWCMLNPSTADHGVLDPTLRRCRGFSIRWGYGGMIVVNAYAFRATDPPDLWSGAPDPVGPANDEQIRTWTADLPVVVGWGVHCTGERASAVLRSMGRATRIDCLGKNGNGSPRHPLYLRNDLERVKFARPRGETAMEGRR